MDSGVTSKVIGPDFTAIAASLTSTTATSPAPSPSQTSSGNTGPPDWGINAASSSKMNQDVFLYTFIALIIILIVISLVVMFRLVYLRRRIALMLEDDSWRGCPKRVNRPRPMMCDIYLHEVPDVTEKCSRIQPLSLSPHPTKRSTEIPKDMLPIPIFNPFKLPFRSVPPCTDTPVPDRVQIGVLISMPSPFPLGKYATEFEEEGLDGLVMEVGVCEERVPIMKKK